MPHNGKVLHRRFHGGTGGDEHYLSVEAPNNLDFKDQVAFVLDRCRGAQQDLGLDQNTAVFQRIFLSDVLNQASFVRESDLLDESIAVSIVQQPPLNYSKIALLSYHIKSHDPIKKRRLSPKHLLVEKNGKRHLWSTRLCTCDRETTNSSEKQTVAIFEDLIGALSMHGANLCDHCVRTWIYMKDVDVFYKGMVESRRDLFNKQGLTGNTHYIASTGIEGACSHRFDLVSMDAYSNLDLEPGQMTYLNDFDQLCHTKDYNVTFERGAKVSYADRSHLFISGTASIDKAGDVVHPGDVMRQLERALVNVEALLKSGQSTLADMMHWIVYLRDPADYIKIDQYLRDHFPHVPMVIVQGSVCRPGWLVEIEGIAITANDSPALPFF